MNLLNLIDHLKSSSLSQAWALREAPLIEEYEFVNVYLRDSISIESDILLLDAEKIPDAVFVEGGVKYINLFTLESLQEMVEELLAEKPDANNYAIATRIVEYRINDA